MICMQTKNKEQVTLHQIDVDKYELEILSCISSTKAYLTEAQVIALSERINKHVKQQ